MSKFFKNIDQQIEILKSRNLIIDDIGYAKNTLLRYNYYKIINGTSKFFIDDDKRTYRQGVDFQDLVDVHNFDKNLKKILLSSMLELERIARSIISYKYVEKYPEPGDYLNIKNYSKYDKSLALVNIDNLKTTIEKYMEEENYHRSMQYYMKKYGSIPFWFIINFISFGKLVNIFETLDNNLKEDICDEFQKIVEDSLGRKIDSYLTPSHLQSFLENARDIRNVSAHDNLILDINLREIEYYKPIHELFNINKDDKKDTLYDTLVILQALLPKETSKELKDDINKEMKKLEQIVDKIAYEKIINTIGFKKLEEKK